MTAGTFLLVGTIGFSGASLANLMNEAAIVAARRDKKEITYEEVDYAIDRLTVGMQKTTGVSFPNRQRLVAYHEAGHAVMGALLPGYDMVTKVTIIPRTNGAGGFTLFTPSEERLDSGLYSKRCLGEVPRRSGLTRAATSPLRVVYLA